MDEALKTVLAIIAAIAAPACGVLVVAVKRLYADLQRERDETVTLLREVLEAIRTLRNGAKP